MLTQGIFWMCMSTLIGADIQVNRFWSSASEPTHIWFHLWNYPKAVS